MLIDSISPRSPRGSAPEQGGATGRIRALRAGWLLAVLLSLPATLGQGDSVEVRPIPRPELTRLNPPERVLIRDARGVLDRLIASEDPDRELLAEGYGGMGQLYLAFEFDEAAMAALINAVQLAPNHFDWTYYLGVASQREGDSEAAEQMLRRARSFRPDDVPTLLRLGAVQLSMEHLHAARTSFTDALELDPQQAAAAARYGLGLVLSEQNAYEAAIPHFEAVLEVQPEATSVHYPLSRAYLRTGDLAKARTHRTVGGEGPVEFADPLIDHLRSLASGAAVQIMLGRDGVRRGRPDLAISAFRKAIEVDPTNIIARQELAAQLRATGDLAGAEAEYIAILELDPDDALARYNLATLMVDRGDTDQALDHYRMAIGSKPDFKEAHFNLGSLLFRAERYAEAATHFEKVLELDPDLPAARQRLADCLQALGRPDRATLEMRESIERDPESGEPHLRLAAALVRQGKLAEAEAALETSLSLELDPEREALAWATLGDVARRRTDSAAALEHYRQAVRMAPEFLEARYRLAEAFHTNQQYQKAVQEYEEILDRRPDLESAHVGKIAALIRAKRYRAAVTAYEEGLLAAPDSVRIAHGYARFLATSPAAATRDGERALELALKLAAEHDSRAFTEVVAMAYAETGQFGEAVEWQERVVAEVEQLGLDAQVEVQRKRLEAYKAGKPCRSPWLTPQGRKQRKKR